MRHARSVLRCALTLVGVVLLTPLAAGAQAAPDPCPTLAGSALAGPAGCGPGTGGPSSTTTTSEPAAGEPAPPPAPTESGVFDPPPPTSGGGLDLPATETPTASPTAATTVDEVPSAGADPSGSLELAGVSSGAGNGHPRDAGRVLLALVVSLVAILYLGVRGAQENRARVIAAAQGAS